MARALLILFSVDIARESFGGSLERYLTTQIYVSFFPKFIYTGLHTKTSSEQRSAMQRLVPKGVLYSFVLKSRWAQTINEITHLPNGF
jgi:hypothetical protein